MLPPSNLSPSRPTVLVVDDSLEALNGLCNLLRADCNALFGFNGLEALALATSESPDLIVLDVAMPGMDGYEVLRRLKEEPCTQDIPVIFLTAPGPSVSEVRALELGAIDFVTKPYDPAILKLRMQNQLAYKRSLDLAMALSLGDALTGIANRRRFDEHLQQEWNRALRNQKPISMILMDIDHFKRFNDALGHPAGDACLQRVAEVLKNSLKRSMDFVARYGGEEFVCILSETDAPGALDVAKRIAARMAAAAIAHPDSPVASTVTLSLGVATMIPTQDQSPLDLTQEADSRLYEAKRLGRNRIQSEPVPKISSENLDQASGILLVEGDESQAEFLKNRLLDFGLEIRTTADGTSAMNAIQQHKPILILSSNQLSDMSGYDFCSQLKKNPMLWGIPFAISASPWEAPSEKCLQAEVDSAFFMHEEDAVFHARIQMLLALGQRPGANRANVSGASFLLLSSSSSLRSMVLAQLSMEGIRTTFAADMKEAIPALQEDLPDAVILDLNLLDEAPAEALDRLRAVKGCNHLPILVLADGNQSLLVDALKSRIQDRLTTPLDPLECRHRARLLARYAFLQGRSEETRTHYL